MYLLICILSLLNKCIHDLDSIIFFITSWDRFLKYLETVVVRIQSVLPNCLSLKGTLR